MKFLNKLKQLKFPKLSSFFEKPWVQASGLFIYASILFLFLNWDSFKGEFYPVSDIAANDFQIVEIQRGNIGLGAYSRFQFNHPGPAYFYLASFSESVFKFLESNTSRHALISYIFNISIFAFLVYAISKDTNSIFSGFAFWISLLFVWKSLGFGFLFETWTPYLMLASFALFIFSVAKVSFQNWSFLPWAFLSASFLFQLNVMGIMPTVAGIGFVVYQWRKAHKNKEWVQAKFKKQIITSLILTLIIWAPVLLDLFFNFPGNISKVFAYILKGGGNKKPVEVFAFLKLIFETIIPFSFGFFFYGILMIIPYFKDSNLDPFAKRLRDFCLFYTFFLFLTLFRMKGPILPHLFWHFYSILAFQIYIVFLSFWKSKEFRLTSIPRFLGVLSFVSLCVLVYGKVPVRDRNMNVKEWSDALGTLGDKFSLHWDTNANDFEQGKLVLGIANELNRRGKSVCLRDPWLFLVPSKYHCNLDSEVGNQKVYLVFKSTEREEATLLKMDNRIHFMKTSVEIGNKQ